MFGTRTAPEELARWLLAQEAGTSPGAEELAAAAERIYAQLRQGLSVFFGQGGFDSLWTRAMRTAKPAVLWGATDGEVARAAPPTQFQAMVADRDADEARADLIAMFASFISLLYTFVGAALGLRLLREVWPELPVDDPGAHTGEVRQ